MTKITKSQISKPYDFKHISGMDESGKEVDNMSELAPVVRKKLEMSGVNKEIVPQIEVTTTGEKISERDNDIFSPLMFKELIKLAVAGPQEFF